MTPHEFLDALIQFCTLYPASVTSYHRTPLHNTKVGGVRYSAHKAWCGADVVYDDGANLNGKNDWAQRLGLRLITEADHDHLQPLDWKAG